MAREFGNCRGCGAKLYRAEYVRFGKVVTEADEQGSGVSREYEGAEVYSWIHKPCPECGEPRPLSRPWRSWALLAGFAAIFAFGLWLEFG